METLITIFAVYMVANLLTQTNGPADIFFKLQRKFEGFQCFLCTSVYISALLSPFITDGLVNIFIYTFGLAGGATIIYWIEENYSG